MSTKFLAVKVMLPHEILNFPGSFGIPEKLQAGVSGFDPQGAHQGQVFLNGVVPQRWGRDQPGKGETPVPPRPPGIVETYPGPGAGKPGIQGAPVTAGKFQDQIKAASPQGRGKFKKIPWGVVLAIYGEYFGQSRVFGEHGLHALGHQGTDLGLRPGLFQGGDYRGSQEDIAQMFELNNEDTARTSSLPTEDLGPMATPRLDWRINSRR